jgi:hypothetical protein
MSGSSKRTSAMKQRCVGLALVLATAMAVASLFWPGGVNVVLYCVAIAGMVITGRSGTEALAHLLACLGTAVDLMDASGFDVDARVIEAHRAELAAGREWPGQAIRPWIGPDERRLTAVSDA